MGRSEEYLDDHDGQVVLFEASRDAPYHLQLDLDDEMDARLTYNPHIRHGMFCDIPQPILGGDETASSFDYSPWTAFSTRHSDPWTGREQHDLFLVGPPGTNALGYHMCEEGFLGGEEEDLLLSQEDHVLTAADDHPFAMTAAGDCFQEDGYRYHHAVDYLEDGMAEDEEMEEDDDGFIYTDGQGNCYTFEPHDGISHEAEFPDNVHHLATLQHTQMEEEHRRWFHDC